MAHRVGRDVREVDEHADAVHLAHHLDAKGGEPADGRLVGGRVGPRDVVVVGQRQVTDTQHVQHPQGCEGTTDGVATLSPDEGGDPPRREDRLQLVRGASESQPVAIPGDHLMDGVDLFQGLDDRRAIGQRGGDPGRPELRADAAVPQPGQVGVRGGQALGKVQPVEVVARLLACLPREVVVSVDQRVPAQELGDAGEGVWREVGHAAIQPQRPTMGDNDHRD